MSNEPPTTKRPPPCSSCATCATGSKRTRDAEVPFYFVQGTEYHEGRGAEELESIAARVKGANIQSNFTGRQCKELLDLVVDGIVVNFAHHLGGGSGFTRSAALDGEAIWNQITSSKGESVAADLIVRSHVHFFCTLNKAIAIRWFAPVGNCKRVLLVIAAPIGSCLISALSFCISAQKPRNAA